jgi:polyhydroxybutyrate depolymerase
MRAIKITWKRLLIGVVLLIFGLPVLAILIVVGCIRYFDETNGVIICAGQQRTYLLYVPPSYNPTRPTPLVISMHGAGGWPALQKNISHWNQLADENGFIVVYPAGTELPKIWHVDLSAGRSADVDLISQLMSTLSTTYNIDQTRIYVDGLSNGGGMAFVLSCALADRIAAVGLVASAQSLPFSWCVSQHAVPMIAFHGTADPIVPYQGGPSKMSSTPFPNIKTWTADWARRNGCEPNPVDTVLASDVTRSEYRNCDARADVVLYTIQGGGHSWPGGKPLPEWWVGRTSNGIDATRQMWEFFRVHQLNKQAVPK